MPVLAMPKVNGYDPPMAKTGRKTGATRSRGKSGLERRLAAFLTERYPLAASRVLRTLSALLDPLPVAAAEIEAKRAKVRESLQAAVGTPVRLRFQVQK